MNEGGSTYIRIWSKLFIDFVPCNFLRDINMQKESNVHHHLCFCHFPRNQKIWICLKTNKKSESARKPKKSESAWNPKKSEPAWRWCLARSGELAPPHSSSADVSQSIVTTFSLRSRYDMWRNHDMMTICAYDSEHDPRQYEGKRSCLFQFVFWKNISGKYRK